MLLLVVASTVSSKGQLYFSRSSSKTVEHRSTHKTAVRLGSSSPDCTAKADQERCQIYRSTAERSAQWNPNFGLIHIHKVMKCRAYQMKLLKPSTRIATPVNWMTSFRFESKASINCGNMGARANGPIPWTNVAAVAHVKVENFQKVLQFLTKLASELKTMLEVAH